MFGSSAGLPYWHHATASSPSKTSAACARSSSTSCFLRARLPSAVNVFSAWKVLEPRAPAAAEHTGVPLDEPREGVPGIRVERLDHEVGHGVFGRSCGGG